MVLPGYITVCTGSNLRLQFPEFLSEHWCVEKKQVLGAICPVCHWLLEGGRCGPVKSSHLKVASELTLSDVAIETLLLASEGSKVDVGPRDDVKNCTRVFRPPSETSAMFVLLLSRGTSADSPTRHLPSIAPPRSVKFSYSPSLPKSRTLTRSSPPPSQDVGVELRGSKFKVLELETVRPPFLGNSQVEDLAVTRSPSLAQVSQTCPSRRNGSGS